MKCEFCKNKDTANYTITINASMSHEGAVEEILTLKKENVMCSDCAKKFKTFLGDELYDAIEDAKAFFNF